MPTVEATIAVKGMTCEGCVRSLTKGLARLKGVSKVEVSLPEGCARVLFDPAVAGEAAIKSKIRDLGYEA